jgi:uncharacterized membrane protein YphA (DoxX/SURF4 family)
MNLLKNLTGFLGRACLSFIFILSAIQEIVFWGGSEQLIMGALYDWMQNLQTTPWAAQFVETLLYWVPFLLILAILFKGIGGLLIFLGIKVRLGAVLLILFLIPATIMFHSFWLLQGDQREMQMINFLKNLSIFGGLLILLAFGGKGEKSSFSK